MTAAVRSPLPVCAAMLVCALLVFAAPAPAVAADKAADAVRWLAVRTEALSYEHGEGVAKDRRGRLVCTVKRRCSATPRRSSTLAGCTPTVAGSTATTRVRRTFSLWRRNRGTRSRRKCCASWVSRAPRCPNACVRRFLPTTVAICWLPAVKLRNAGFGLVRQLAPQYGVSPRHGSGGHPRRVQLQPAGALEQERAGPDATDPGHLGALQRQQPFDPEQNLRGGLAYLRWLLAYFEGDVSLVAAAYNAGEGAVNRYRGVPPYAETRGYVKRIMSLFQREAHPYDASVTTPSPELPRIRLTQGS